MSLATVNLLQPDGLAVASPAAAPVHPSHFMGRVRRACDFTFRRVARPLPALYQFQLAGELEREAAGSDILVALIKLAFVPLFQGAFSGTYFHQHIFGDVFSGTRAPLLAYQGLSRTATGKNRHFA
jgi:hypothetical protein